MHTGIAIWKYVHYLQYIQTGYNKRLTGSRHTFNIARENRICPLCNNEEIGDEFHYLFKCQYFGNQRKIYIKKNIRINPTLKKRKKVKNKKNIYLLYRYRYIFVGRRLIPGHTPIPNVDLTSIRLLLTGHALIPLDPTVQTTIRKFDGFLRFPPLIKLTTTIQL
jgi:hypothetical protein